MNRLFCTFVHHYPDNGPLPTACPQNGSPFYQPNTKARQPEGSAVWCEACGRPHRLDATACKAAPCHTEGCLHRPIQSAVTGGAATRCVFCALREAAEEAGYTLRTFVQNTMSVRPGHFAAPPSPKHNHGVTA